MDQQLLDEALEEFRYIRSWTDEEILDYIKRLKELRKKFQGFGAVRARRRKIP